jgi:2-haloacid dehalogenase
MATHRPDAVVFDVVETLFGLQPVAAALESHGVAASALDVFFTRLLRDGFALGATGVTHSFPVLADAALSVVAPSLDPEGRGAVLAAFGELDAYPDVRPAIDRLLGAGVRVAALTNGSAANTAKLLERNGLGDAFELVVSVDEVGMWKPRPEPYHHILERLGLSGDRVAMVAVHAWDVHGARSAGLLTGWASRLEGVYAPVFDTPDVRGRDLVEVVDELLSL